MTSKLLEERYREALRELSVANKDNMMCVDCMAKKKTSFVVLQFQSYICEMCADVHRTYGHRGVKQIGLSNFTKDEVEEMRQGGNQKVKATWYGGNYDQIVRPNPDLCGSDKEFKEKAKEHIKKVYIQRVYKSSNGNVGLQVEQQTNTLGSSNNQSTPMPYNNVQYNGGGIDTRTRGASLNSTQYANLKTSNSSSIIQSSNISGVNNSGNNGSNNDLISFGTSNSSQPPKQPTSQPTIQPQPTIAQPQPTMNNYNNNQYGQPQPSYGNNYPPNNNYNQGMPPMNNMQYGNQPMMNNNNGYGYNNNMNNNNMMNSNYNYNNNYGYNNGMMNNNMNNNGYGYNNQYGQPQQYNNNFNNGYGQPQPTMNNMNNMNNQPQQFNMTNTRPQVSSPPQTPPVNNYGTTPNVNTVPRQPSNNNPMGYNNQYGTPMTPSQPSTITPPVNSYVGTSPRGNSNIPTVPTNVPQPPSSTLNVVSPSRSSSMPPKSTPPSFGSTSTPQPPSFVATPPKQPTQPIVQPIMSSSSIPPKKSSVDTDNLSKQFNNMNLTSSSTAKPPTSTPVTTSTIPKSTPPSFGSTTTQPKPVAVTATTGVLVGSTKKIDSNEFEKATTTGVNMDDLRGNASKDNLKFKEINPNRVIPMKQTTDWQ